MSKKFFRPPAQQFDDDSDEDSDDEELLDEDDEVAPAPSQATGTISANLSDGSEDDDDDDDDDEKEVEEATKRKSSTSGGREKKRLKASSFFDIEAEASDDDDDDDQDYARNKDKEEMDEEAKEIMRQQDRRRAQAGLAFSDRSVQDISREIEQRHRMQNRTVDRSRFMERPQQERPVPNATALKAKTSASLSRPVVEAGGAVDGGGGGPEVYSAVAQQSLMPSVSDPSLWMVSCLGGKEQELVFQIMNKCSAFARQGRPLGISAAITGQTRGKIYIESFSEPAVMEAIQGVRGLMQSSMRLVPIQDMTTVLNVTSTKKPVKKNEWVRMARGQYKGDLALVMGVKESGLKCIIQCVPRLDLTLSDLTPEEARVRRKTVRPPQKFFHVQEIAALGKHSLRQRFPGLDLYCDYFEGNYYKDGYLLKEMAVGTMVKPTTDEDPPTLDELQRFQKRKAENEAYEDGVQENEGSKMAASLLDELSELQGTTGMGRGNPGGAGLLIGDTVEVTEGDLIGMRGKLVSMDGSTVKIIPTNTSVDLGGTDEVEFLASQVRKFISVGAHVKITDGRYANETGVVVAVDQSGGEIDFTAVVLTDVTNKEISVRTSQLRESAEVASGQDKLQGYELFDLVVLSGGGSANEVGVIVRVGREDFTVINNHGIAREVRPEELRGKRNSTSMRAVALDVQGNQIRVGDTVNVVEGPHKGKSATIKRVSRAQLFLHSQTRSEHAGIFVVRSRSCILAGNRSQARGASADAGASPFATPQSQSFGGSGPARAKRDDFLTGKTVRIQSGQWKGYLGTVADSTATHVQVELHSRLKKVMVVRERVAVVGDKFGATDIHEADAQIGTMAAPNNMATPMHVQMGGATPAVHGFGGATPAHNTENSEDVWRPGGAIDQTDAVKEEDDDGWGSTSDPFEMTKTEDSWSGTGQNPTWSVKEELPPPLKQELNPYTNNIVKREIKNEMEDMDNDETPAWFMERVCVSLKSDETQAVIKEINTDKTALIELDDKSIKTVRVSDLTFVLPKEHDTVLVIGGNEIGLEGSLVCVDGSDAILKDANDEFKIIEFSLLVKITGFD
ncbi:hypothetical protein MPSEU_000562100 [Mayamaea pseudoterrestris]|nr:hypothetical protein MPSEU_000562100 [Mayamaea pseudoterrestris]